MLWGLVFCNGIRVEAIEKHWKRLQGALHIFSCTRIFLVQWLG